MGRVRREAPPAEGETTARRIGALVINLDGVVGAVRWASRARRIGGALWPIPLAFAAIVYVDAAAPLPAWMRAGAGVAILLLALRIPIGLVAERSARRIGRSGAARLIERRLALAGNPIVTGLQLAPLAEATRAGALSGALARRAVERSADAIRATPGARVVDWGSARRAWRLTLGCWLALAALLAVTPRVFAFGWPRLIDPLGDHPPFTRTDFTIRTTPGAPLVGDDIVVDIAVGGRRPATLELVTLDDRARPIDRLPLAALTGVDDEASAPPRAYRQTLREVRAPLRFYVAGPTGRSETIAINPIARPRVRSATLTITPPAYTGWRPTDRAIREGAERPPAEAIVGSRLELRVVTTLPLAGADGSGGVAEVVGDAATLRADAERPEDLRLSLRPYGASGLPTDRIVETTVHVRADEPPSLAVEAPGQPAERIYALAGAPIPVRAGAQDDVRIASLGMSWVVRAADADASGAPVCAGAMDLLDGAGAEHVEGAAGLDTWMMNLVPGDVVQIMVEAADNRPSSRGGAQRVAVGPMEVRIIDEQELQRIMAEQDRAGQDGEARSGASPGRPSSPEGARKGADANNGATTEGAARGDSSGPAGAPAGSGDGAPSAGGPYDQAGAGGAAGAASTDAGGGAPGGDRPARPRVRVYDGHDSGEPGRAQASSSPTDTSRLGRRDADASASAAGASARAARGDGAAARGASGDGLSGPAGAGSLADVPERYRDLVSRYFLRIAREQSQRERRGADDR